MIVDKSGIIIRPETPSEYESVNKLIYEAFTESHGIEIGQFMMNHFAEERQKETFVPELSLVAVLNDGTIIGEIAIHETDIATKNGKITQLTLSQSAVLPEYRMHGIMRMLVEYALDKAKNMGYGAVFLGGNPNLYSRFGFEASSKYGIYHKDRNKWGDEGFMVCKLKPDALDGITGTTSYYGG
ncbi:MAG: N-acetyltransferase [Eubacterium sp.]|nr:N-acetyltransferase [Eubacterium sp.]